ncbi:MAG: phospholipase [Acidimicrobiaceae bacterium]|nr:phospholipase [Acidimicrobiaceae bacterium]
MSRNLRLPLVGVVAATLGLTAIVAPATARAVSDANRAAAVTTTPIKHLVVLFQENRSFDHYFGTYPVAANPPGEPRFVAKNDTPSVNGLATPLMAPNNPNTVQPFRLDRSQFQTASQDHAYGDEQLAFDHGLMDHFVESTGRGTGPADQGSVPGGQVMGYFDGNTVTALWNYAQNFALNDNFYNTTFGPSTPGALNLVSGQTHGTVDTASPGEIANNTVIGDPQPTGDLCDTRDRTQFQPGVPNVGDALNTKHLTWGWFNGGFGDCAQSHANKAGVLSKDYIPHHAPFQYFPSTANPQHTPPASVAEIGNDGVANHQYDLSDFWASVDNSTMPAVSFLKAPAYQDGHAGYSDPLDEQEFIVATINRLERAKSWKDTAVVITYDDSDGWYDHQMGPVVNQSQDPANDKLTGTSCGSRADKVAGGYQDRCGYGPRVPLLVVSPFAKANFVDHSTTDQTSVLRFIEDNWQLGRLGNFSFDSKAGSLANMFDFGHNTAHGPDKLFLDPATGKAR